MISKAILLQRSLLNSGNLIRAQYYNHRYHSNNHLNQLIDCSNDPEFPVNDLLIEPDFISSTQHDQLVADADRLLLRNRSKYLPSHFDSVIKQYRELPASDEKWSSQSQLVFNGMRECIGRRLISNNNNSNDNNSNYNNSNYNNSNDNNSNYNNSNDNNSNDKFKEDAIKHLWHSVGGWKSSMHILDLAADGEIGAHVDHVDYCGRLLGALCLISTAVVRFRHRIHSSRFVDCLLEPRTLYAHARSIRYDYTHEIVASSGIGGSDLRQYQFGELKFTQQRRLTIMIRSNQ